MRKCKFYGCEEVHYGRGYCSKHYYDFIVKKRKPYRACKKDRSRLKAWSELLNLPLSTVAHLSDMGELNALLRYRGLI